MPDYDRTGPIGAGPMSGGSRGFCRTEKAGERVRGAAMRCGFGRMRGGRRANDRDCEIPPRESRRTNWELLVNHLNELELKLERLGRKIDEPLP